MTEDSMHRTLDAALARNSGPSAEDVDLAAWLRDWRLADCEHAEVRDGGIICCSPCLRDRILASDWLAAHTATAKREGARAVAERVAALADEWIAADDTTQWGDHTRSRCGRELRGLLDAREGGA